MKKSITFILALIAMLCMSMFFIGCDQPEPEPEEEVQISVELNKNRSNLLLGQTDTFVAFYPVTEGYELTWESSDPAVSVEEGRVEAMKEGSATITATYSNGTDTYTATATVNVTLGEKLPVFYIENNIVGETWNLEKSSTFSIVPYVLFNGTKFYDVEVEFTVSDPAVVSVADNVITALEVGSATIELKASWRGVAYNNQNEMAITLTVNVLN